MNTNTASIMICVGEGAGLIAQVTAGSKKELEVKIRKTLDDYFSARAPNGKWKKRAR